MFSNRYKFYTSCSILRELKKSGLVWVQLEYPRVENCRTTLTTGINGAEIALWSPVATVLQWFCFWICSYTIETQSYCYSQSFLLHSGQMHCIYFVRLRHQLFETFAIFLLMHWYWHEYEHVHVHVRVCQRTFFVKLLVTPLLTRQFVPIRKDVSDQLF